MTHEDDRETEFFFPIMDSAFHWVRTSSLYTPAARRRHLFPRTLFRREESGAGIPVFNRYGLPDYFRSPGYLRKLSSLCISAGVPYLVDLDDLYWELPRYSKDHYRHDRHQTEFMSDLLSQAAAIIASTPELKEHVEQQFPDKPVFVVENSPPAWVAPRCGVLIANTDAFKFSYDQLVWFVELLRFLFRSGLSIQLLGDNENLLDDCGDILVHSLPSEDYRSYLSTLSRSDFRLALVPVEHSSYADCKSAIKAIDFLSQRIPTIASDIAPYRRFSALHGWNHFRVVPNTLEAWRQAAESIVLQIPEAEREQGKEVNAMLIAARDTQLQQWLAVAEFLRDRRPDPALMRRVSQKVHYYLVARELFQPIKRLGQILSRQPSRNRRQGSTA